MAAPGASDPMRARRGRAGGDDAFLRAVLDASSDAIFGIAADGTVRSWNRSAARVFGRPAADAVGSPALALFPPEARTTFLLPGEQREVADLVGPLTAGTHHFQCCIHPWMRLDIEVR